MSTTVFKLDSTGPALMNLAGLTVPAGQTYRLVSVSLHFSATPTTSENFTVTLNAASGPAYDVLLYSVDPGGGALQDIVWMPDEELFLEGGDVLDIAYTNTDNRTWGVQITAKGV